MLGCNRAPAAASGDRLAVFGPGLGDAPLGMARFVLGASLLAHGPARFAWRQRRAGLIVAWIHRSLLCNAGPLPNFDRSQSFWQMFYIHRCVLELHSCRQRGGFAAVVAQLAWAPIWPPIFAHWSARGA